jgi:hypothetical protein
LQVVVECEDQVAQSGVFVGQMRAVAVVELSGQIGEAGVSLFDRGPQCLGKRLGVEGALTP